MPNTHNEITGRSFWDVVTKIGVGKSIIIFLFLIVVIGAALYFILTNLGSGTKIELSKSKLTIEKKTENASALQKGHSTQGSVADTPAQRQADAQKHPSQNGLFAKTSNIFFDSNSKKSWVTLEGPPITWARANEIAESTSLDGQVGWRLPTLAEIKLLYSSQIEFNKELEKDFYWTSQSDNNFALTINPFTNVSRLVSKSENNFVLLVK